MDQTLRSTQRLLRLLVIAFIPLTSSCQMRETPDPQEFRLYAATVTDIFGRGAVRDLARAAAAGNAEAMTRAVHAGADPNARGKEGLTPLFWSIMATNAAGAQALLKAGANPNLPMRINNGKGFEWDEYPVVIAAKGKPAVLKVLLEGGGNPESTSYKLTALRAAVGCLQCVRMLVEHGADVNRDIEGENAGFTAVATGQLDVVIYLLNHGFDIELNKLAWHAQDFGGPTHADPRKQQIVEIIRAKGIEPFVPDWAKKN
ncbi:MAG: ankyrin repeat domain-containing protein [Pseudomonadota bacterium]